jgi:ABC-type uncharacterized transport system ATPase subunit
MMDAPRESSLPEPGGQTGSPLLALQNLTKSFGGLTAVNELSFAVE